jgi:hypothetical protein
LNQLKLSAFSFCVTNEAPRFAGGQAVVRGGLQGWESTGCVRRNLGRSVVERLIWFGQGRPGLLNDLRRGSGVSALGEVGGGKELGVAVGAVTRTQEVEETVLADGDGLRGLGLVGWRG